MGWLGPTPMDWPVAWEASEILGAAEKVLGKGFKPVRGDYNLS